MRAKKIKSKSDKQVVIYVPTFDNFIVADALVPDSVKEYSEVTIRLVSPSGHSKNKIEVGDGMYLGEL
jgi:hypothetical protein